MVFSSYQRIGPLYDNLSSARKNIFQYKGSSSVRRLSSTRSFFCRLKIYFLLEDIFSIRGFVLRQSISPPSKDLSCQRLSSARLLILHLRICPLLHFVSSSVTGSYLQSEEFFSVRRTVLRSEELFSGQRNCHLSDDFFSVRGIVLSQRNCPRSD
jgi:hypothetical protein